MNNKTFFSFCMISFSFCMHAMEGCETKGYHSSSDPNVRLREILTCNKPWQEKRHEIVAIIKNGADSRVKEYIGYRSDGLKDYGNSSLTYAVYNDDYIIASFLLRKGVEIEEDSLWSYTPLFFRAQSKRMAELLVKHGKVNIENKEKNTGNTVLHHLAKSSEKGSSSLFCYYLELGLNPNEKNNDRQTVLDILLNRAFDDETSRKFHYVLEYLSKNYSNFSAGELSEETKGKLRGVERVIRQTLKNGA